MAESKQSIPMTSRAYLAANSRSKPLAATSGRELSIVVLVCFTLAVAVLLAYVPVLHNGFMEVDDPFYVLGNPVVQKGISISGLHWAFFEENETCNWHPLTWLSHMIDCQLFGVAPAWHHAVSLLYHITNTLLLYSLLLRWTAANWRSAFVAALFGLHPMHVESVAWIAERKDVLSVFFGLLALGAYTRAVAMPDRSFWRHWLSLLLYACSLMAKPMLVTLPFMLLLIDYWPLNRIGREPTRRLLIEKIPYLTLSVGSSIVTYVVQQHGGAVISFARASLSLRFENIAVSYVRYLGKLLWPSELTVFYPLPPSWSVVTVVACCVALALITVSLVVVGRTHRFLLVGWFWFLGTLVPVIGFVQVGAQAMADRYSYWPSVGFFIVLVWGGQVLVQSRVWALNTLRFVMVLALLGCAVGTHALAGYWHDDAELWRRVVTLAPENTFSFYNYGVALAAHGRTEEAITAYRRAIYLQPGHPECHNNLALALDTSGKTEEALAEFRKAINYGPLNPLLRENYAGILTRLERYPEAVEQYEAVLRIDPNRTSAQLLLAYALGSQGRIDDAIVQFHTVLKTIPDDPNANFGLAVMLEQAGRKKEALEQWEATLRLQPENAIAHSSLGILLVENGRLDQGIEHLQYAIRLQPDSAEFVQNLRNALRKRDGSGR
jgi:Flp pilus assembly protein TadD